MVNTDDYERTRDLPGVREAFKAARDVDIVVTSLARREDPHSRFNQFMKVAPDEQKRELKAAGWTGDVLWQPFSKNEPILVQNGLRAMSTFDLPLLREWAGRKDKHVVLVAGPCGKCGAHKASALRPLLVEPDLRVSNHLVTHLDTAEALLETKDSQPETDLKEFLKQKSIDSLSDSDLEDYLRGHASEHIDE
jgi:DNA-binding transcriptional regulator LsrR (DeoR family)